MYRFFNKYSRGKPKITQYKSGAVKVARAGLSTNPLQRFNFTSGDVFKIDDLVTTNGTIVETAKSKTYDFLNKVAGSIDLVNCPMRIWRDVSHATLLDPSSPYWFEYGSSDQATFDLLKTQDGNSKTSTTSTNGNYVQYLVELDLTDLANQLGGNAKLKEALTGITVDAYAMGSGSNGGVNTNGVQVSLWYQDSPQWLNTILNSSASITKITSAATTAQSPNRVTTANKVYIQIAAQYPSNGTIASSVSLDYISVKLDYKERTVTKDGSFFVGGDTATHEFSFETKVAGSVVECPMKVYHSYMNAIQPPTNMSGSDQTGFANWLETQQTWLDKIKTQDSPNYITLSNAVNGAIAQILVELDLTPICNALFGGSNAALKAALKSITADVWAMGSGSNASVATNGVYAKLWYDHTGVGSQWGGSSNDSKNSTGASITKISPTNQAPIGSIGQPLDYITSSNKLYILIASQYASDGTIPSSVSLDYLNIKIDIARTPDTVQPIAVNLPKYWAMCGNFSPCFDSSKSGTTNRIFTLFNDVNNRWILSRSTAGIISFTKVKSGTAYQIIASITNTFSKNQIIKYIVGQNSTGMFMYLLKNNGTVEKITNTDINILSGLIPLHMLNQNNLEQADTFTESFTLLDLARLGKSAGLTDADAEIILRGIPVPSEAELVVNGDFAQGSTGWSVVGTPTVDYASGKLSLTTSTVGDTVNSANYDVLPNSQYVVNGILTGSNAQLEVDYRDSAGALLTNSILISTDLPKILSTPFNCYKVSIKLRGSVTGTFTFDNISLKYVKPSGAIAIPNPELFDINKVTLHANATRSNGVITLNATATNQHNTIIIPVLPNNRYELKGITNNGVLQLLQQYNAITLNTNYTAIQSNAPNYILTTLSNCNAITLRLTNGVVGSTGTFTFSNISLKRKD